MRSPSAALPKRSPRLGAHARVLANGIYGFEQFLLDVSFFNNPANAPKPYVALNVWNFAGAKGLGVQFAQNVDTPAALDGALAAAKAFNGPS
jgi:indolepyruvate decarboxylase